MILKTKLLIQNKDSLNIIIIGPAHPFRGGLSSYNHRLAEEFIQHGHQVKIFTFTLQYPGILFPGKTQISNDAPPANLDIEQAINSINPLNWIHIGRRLKKLNPNIILCKFWLPFMGPCFGTILKIASKNNHTKVISIIDNLIPHERRIGDRTFAKYFTRQVHGFIAQSKSVLDDLKSFGIIQQVKLIPHPIYDNYGDPVEKKIAAQHLNLDLNQQYLLFFGFIRDYKGLDILLQAMAEPILKDLNIKLIVAGEFYNNEETHLKLIERLGIADRVLLHTHFISNDDVRYYFGVSDLVVQPYKSATQSGISQMAYHFEKPMVVTNVGGLPEIVPDEQAGYVTEVNPLAVAKAIKRFFEEDKANEFKEFIKIKKKEYSWETMMNSIIELSNERLPS